MAFTKTPSISKQQSKPHSFPEDFTKQFPNSNSKSPFSKPKSFIIIFPLLFSLLFLSLLLLSFRFKPISISTPTKLQNPLNPNPIFFEEFKNRKKLKIGVVNLYKNDREINNTLQLLGLSENRRRNTPVIEMVNVRFDRVNASDLDWESLFPDWINEEEDRESQKCPEIPMAVSKLYGYLDVIVARMPCGKSSSSSSKEIKKGIRDVIRLQVNLVVANLAVESGWIEQEIHRTVYVVFVGSCGPMQEIFKCEEMVMKNEDYWVYKPEIKRLKQKILMPVGSCQLAPVYAQTGKEVWRNYMKYPKAGKNSTTQVTIRTKPREAYVTILHSSEAYVCGAIALAQSIIKTKSTKDLILLADDSITPKSIQGLRSAGWNIRSIHRIRSPFSEKGSYNEWNYSKLRIWQLVDYDKIIFIDSDLLVFKNIDHFFALPQLSAATNNKMRFNSGLMVVEPSMCLFEDLMEKSFEVESYNNGDQGFLNEVFTWWHKLPTKVNNLKINEKENGEISSESYAIHYLGLKPWMCYRDYDCNWDMENHHEFASDKAHEMWWRVYEGMPKELQEFCGITKKMDDRIRKWRGIARNDSLENGHWKIEIKDPRQYQFLDQ